ncbi:hypothetical protein ACTFIZ_008321 [Dictyostelium cf. discoideum]
MEKSIESTSYSNFIILDNKNYKKWDNETVCKWLLNIKTIQKVSIEIFQANEIIGKDLEFLTDKILLKMGVGIREILDFKFEYQILKTCYNNNNNNNNNINNNNNNINNFNYNFNYNFNININKNLLKIVVNAPIININEYQYIETISKSKFCEIEKYKKIKTLDNEYIIIKKIIKNSSLNEEKLINEIDTIYLLNHPNLIKIIGYYKDKNNFYIGMKYYETFKFKDNNNSNILKFGKNFEQIIRKISFKILSAINYLHSLEPPIIHGNINEKNIVFDENNEPILIDFGLSYKSIDKITNQKTQFTNPCFVSPEFYYKKTKNKISKEADIFSFGSTISNLLKIGSDFKEDNAYDEERIDQNLLLKPFVGIPNCTIDNISFDCKSLLCEINKYEPCFRPNSKQLLNSFWFVEPSFETTEITTDLLIDYLKNYGCYIIRDDIAMVSLPFNQEIYDSSKIIISQFSYQPKINEKHKYFKKSNQFYSKILSKSLQVKIGWYLLNLNKEFNDKPYFKNIFLSFSTSDKFIFNSNQDLNLKLTKYFYNFLTMTLIYQAIYQKPKSFKIVEYL